MVGITTMCVTHSEVAAVGTCRSCGRRCCADCLVYSYGASRPPHCMSCALTAAGAVREPAVEAAGQPTIDLTVDADQGVGRQARDSSSMLSSASQAVHTSAGSGRATK